MPILWAYARDLFTTPGFGDTTDFVHIKSHYYEVHRDINPDNVLLAPDGGRLADLGLAQVLQPGVAVTGIGRVAGREVVGGIPVITVGRIHDDDTMSLGNGSRHRPRGLARFVIRVSVEEENRRHAP